MKSKFLVIVTMILFFTILSIVFISSLGADSRNTGNPNECWYQEEDGSLTPCKMDGRPSVMMFFVLFWPYIIFGIVLMVIFTVWRKRK